MSNVQKLRRMRRNAFLMTLFCVVCIVGSWFLYAPSPFFQIIFPVVFAFAMLLWARSAIRDHRALKQATS